MQVFYLLLKEQKEIHGKIQGTIDGKPTIGEIYKNTGYGVYGNLENLNNLLFTYHKPIPVALRSEISLGKATMISTLDNEAPKEYEIEIEKIYTNNHFDNKSMVIKITDQNLLEKSGGIVQGMSGSPIVQNGKLIGALTHVLVNDSKLRICSICRAYGKTDEGKLKYINGRFYQKSKCFCLENLKRIYETFSHKM